MKDTKKLLFLGTYPPPYGGISSHLYDLLPSLQKTGHKVISFTPYAEKNMNDEFENGLRIIKMTTRKMFVNNSLKILLFLFLNIKYLYSLKLIQYIRLVSCAFQLRKIIKNERIDIVYTFEEHILIIPFLKKIINNNIIINSMIFGEYYLYPDKFLKMKLYMKKCFSLIDQIYSSSQYCAESIEKVFSFKFSSKVIYVGVDENIYFPAKNNQKFKSFLNIPESSFVYFFLGRMDKSMGIDFLIENAEKILNIGENVYLILAGAKGSYSVQVNELSNKYDRIKYYENIPFDQKLSFYHACDVYLAPTMQKHACMGVSIKEAMACGKPIIASNSGGIPEAITNGENGFMIDTINGKLDSEDFIKKLEMIYKDELLREKMSKKGRKVFLEKFTNKITLNKYLEIINELS
jgi:glycosyltransferase involved in cell wall biosynthesis